MRSRGWHTCGTAEAEDAGGCFGTTHAHGPTSAAALLEVARTLQGQQGRRAHELETALQRRICPADNWPVHFASRNGQRDQSNGKCNAWNHDADATLAEFQASQVDKQTMNQPVGEKSV